MSRMFVLVAVCAALALAAQSALAQHRPIDRRLTGVSIGVGAAATAGYFAINGWKWKWNNASGLTQAGAIGITTLGCAAVAPMVATVVLNRPLTMREGHVMVASCIIPIIGGWLVEQAYDAHPEWEPASAPVHHRKTRAKKM